MTRLFNNRFFYELTAPEYRETGNIS